MTKLAGTLPDNPEANGLDAIAPQLIAEPNQVHLAVMLIDCKEIKTMTDTGDEIPTARIRRVEVITEDRDRVVQLLRRAMESRLGRTTLPLDMEDDLRALGEGL